MAAVMADTHAAIWYLLESPDLSGAAFAALDAASQAGDPIFVASISLVEVVYLIEKRRLPEAALELLNLAIFGEHAPIVVIPLDLAVAQAVRRVPRDVVPEMPDRIIAATALHFDIPLVTRDHRIQASDARTIW